MADPIIGEIRIFAGNYAPQDWHLCDGQLLSINEHQALYSLLGTTYGGDGHSTFGLPDLRGRLPVGQGAGPGLTPRRLGQTTGTEKVTLQATELPGHTHAWMAATAVADSNTPAGTLLAATASEPLYDMVTDPKQITPLNAPACGATGGGQPHDNVMPGLAINYIICLNGFYPERP